MLNEQDLTLTSPWKAELVKDIFPDSPGFYTYHLMNFNNTLYFNAAHVEKSSSSFAIGTEQLWKSDGTEAGTILVKDQGSFENSFFSSEIYNNTLYFEVSYRDPNTNTSNFQLWKTDGKDTGLELIKTLGSDIVSFIPIDNTLYFTAGTFFGGTQLWKTDGTETGTVLVKDFDSTIANSQEINNSLYLYINEYNTGGYNSKAQLWKIDSTPTGVELIKDFGDLTFLGNPNKDDTPIVNNTLYFEVGRPYNSYSPSTALSQLWKSDGTDTETTLVKDFWSIRDIDDILGNFNNNIYFFVSVHNSEDSLATTRELWKSDGTDSRTTLVKDFGKGRLNYLDTVNNTLYFSVNGIDPITKISNTQLWKVDGTNGNASLVKDLGNLSILNWEALDNTLYFHGSKYQYNTNTSTAQLWKTDGTESGTTLIKDFPNSSFIGTLYNDQFKSVNNTLYFPLTDPNSGTELWMSDGTETGTMMVADINPGKGSSNPSIPVDVNGTLYLVADDGIHGNELWKLTPIESNPILQEGLRSNAKALAMSHLKSISQLISSAYPAPTFSNPFETPSNLGFI